MILRSQLVGAGQEWVCWRVVGSSLAENQTTPKVEDANHTRFQDVWYDFDFMFSSTHWSHMQYKCSTASVLEDIDSILNILKNVLDGSSGILGMFSKGNLCCAMLNTNHIPIKQKKKNNTNKPKTNKNKLHFRVKQSPAPRNIPTPTRLNKGNLNDNMFWHCLVLLLHFLACVG